MPRAKRLDLPGIAQHVVQRGNNREACFFRRNDRLRYLQVLEMAAGQFGCSIHAFVLMTNHVHLLVTPCEKGAVGRMMQSVGRAYVRSVNNATGRTGTLWEGRYKSCLVEGEEYLLACHRYIDLNPVRAGIVPDPGDYEWSSYQAHALGIGNPVLTPHKSYLALGETAGHRRAEYRRLVESGIDHARLEEIRLMTRRQRVFASDAFRCHVEDATGQKAGIGKPGRPRKSTSSGAAPAAEMVL